MKLLITGATGFIGSHLVRYFINRGDKVDGTYRRTLRNEVPGCRYLRIDLSEEDLEPQSYDCVIHCAAQVETGDVWGYVKNCILATKRLLTFFEKQHIDKLIFMSSIAVYGEGGGAIINEESKGINLSSYGLVKRLCEGLIKESFVKSRHIIRLSRVLGEGGFDVPGGGQFLAKTAAKMARNEEVVYTNGEVLYNNMFHVTEVARLCAFLLSRDIEEYQCIGAAASEPIPITEILHLMRKTMKSFSPLREEKNEHVMTCLQIDTMRLERLGFHALSVAETINKFSDDAVRRYVK